MRRVVALLTILLLLSGASSRAPIEAQSNAEPPSVAAPDRVRLQKPEASKAASILFWSASKIFVEGWVRSVPSTDTGRMERLRSMFTHDECKPEEQTVPKKNPNLICTLEGDTTDVVVIAAHYDHSGKGSGAVEDWSGAAMLPLLYHAMQVTKRHNTFVFAAFDGERGAQVFFNSRKGPARKQIRAVLDLDDLGLSSTRSCTYPDNSDRFLQDLSLEHALIATGKQMGNTAMPERERCYDVVKADDTQPFRKAQIPALVIHSVTHQKVAVPWSEQDTPAAIDPPSYYDTYQLIATYLCILDRDLELVLTLGVYDPIAEALSVARSHLTLGAEVPHDVAADLVAELLPSTNDLPVPGPPGRLAPEPARSSASLPGLGPSGPTPGMVVLDVVATMKDGTPVAGLTSDQFQVLEDGQPQQITRFEGFTKPPSPPSTADPSSEASSSAAVATAAPAITATEIRGAKPGLPGPLPARLYYTNAPPPIDTARVLILDSMNTPNSDTAYERRSMIAFLKDIPPETHIAVFGLGSRLWMFQGLASDSTALLTAVDRVIERRHAASASQPPPPSPAGQTSTPLSQTVNADGKTPASQSPSFSTALERDLWDFETDAPLTACGAHPSPPSLPNSTTPGPTVDPPPTPGCVYTAATRAQLTFEGFRLLGRYLAAIPGRKSILWFSQSFPLPLVPDDLARMVHAMSDQNTDQVMDYSGSMLRLADQFADQRLSIYPIDSSGVNWPRPALKDLREDPAIHRNYVALWAAPAQQTSQMKSLGEATGGHPFAKTNELKEALARAALEDSNHYTLAYMPSNTAHGGGFRNVVVKLNGADYNLAYRRGRYDLSPRPPLEGDKALLGATPVEGRLDQDFANVLRPGPPAATQIIFNARARRARQQPIPGSVRYNLDYSARYDFLLLTAPQTGRLLFAATANAADGKQVQSVWKPSNFDLSPEGRATLATEGARFQMEIDVPKTATTLTLGVYDPATQRMGTLDIPLAGDAPK